MVRIFVLVPLVIAFTGCFKKSAELKPVELPIRCPEDRAPLMTLRTTAELTLLICEKEGSGHRMKDQKILIENLLIHGVGTQEKTGVVFQANDDGALYSVTPVPEKGFEVEELISGFTEEPFAFNAFTVFCEAPRGCVISERSCALNLKADHAKSVSQVKSLLSKKKRGPELAKALKHALLQALAGDAEAKEFFLAGHAKHGLNPEKTLDDDVARMFSKGLNLVVRAQEMGCFQRGQSN